MDSNVDPAELAKHLKTTVAAYKILRDLICRVKTPVRHYLVPVSKSIERIAEDFFCHKIGYGQPITTRGFLSKYVLTHRPDFYIPYTHKAEDVVINPSTSSPSSGHVTMKMAPHHTQLPVQIFPPIAKGNETLFLYFLYYPSFQSFQLEQDDEKVGRRKELKATDDILKIEDLHKPIFVVSNKPLQLETECVVKITGVLKELDEDLTKSHIQELSKTQREIFHNTLRPFNEGATSLCIDLRKDGYVSIDEKRDSLPATIYVESHFENIIDPQIFNIIVGDALPGAFPGLHWCGTDNSEVKSALCSSDVFVVTRQFTHYAFYIPSNILHNRVYNERLSQLHGFCNIFRKNVQNKVRQLSRQEAKMVYDFLFDFRRAPLFHPKGVLVSKEIEAVLSENPHLRETVDWLRNV